MENQQLEKQPRPVSELIKIEQATELTPAEQILIQKFTGWGKVGIGFHNLEIELNLSAQTSIQKLFVPVKMEEVPAAEAALKQVKADQVLISNKRKEGVKNVSEVLSRFMNAEKSLEAPIKEHEQAIIKVKAAWEKAQLQIRKKNDERTKFIETINQAAIAHNTFCETKINNIIEAAYAYALNAGEGRKDAMIEHFRKNAGEGNVTPEALRAYLHVVSGMVTEKSFSSDDYKPMLISEKYLDTSSGSAVSTPYHSELEKANLILEFFKPGFPETYVQNFKDALDKKFFDYVTAFNNKEAALKQAAKEKLETEAKIAEKAQTSEVANTLSSLSGEFNPQPTLSFETKALKKAYEIAMDNTYENAMLILSVFHTLGERAKAKTTVKDWFKFGADSAGKALSKLKSEDNSIVMNGIIFKEVDKL